ncbi:hypothetical protein GW17_00019363, partial [Ensete ventricosum]
NVKHSPPAFRILALAVSVNLRAVTFIAGTSYTLLSSVTVDIVGSGSGAPGLLAPTAGNEIDTLPRRTSTRSEAGQVHKERRRRIGLHEKRGEQGSGSRLTMVDSGEELLQCSRRGG